MRVSPDLDATRHALGTPEQLHAPSHQPAGPEHFVTRELVNRGVLPAWSTVQDQGLATHLARTQWLAAGLSLTEVTDRLLTQDLAAQVAGPIPATGRPHTTVLPVSDTPMETHVVLEDDQGRRAVHVQEWEHRFGSPTAESFGIAGLAQASPTDAVLNSIRAADVLVLAPGDPLLQLGAVLAVGSIREEIAASKAPVIGLGIRASRSLASCATLTATLSAMKVSDPQELWADLDVDWWDQGAREAAGRLLRGQYR